MLIRLNMVMIMGLLRRIIASSLSTPARNSSYPCHCYHQLFVARFLHNAAKPEGDTVVNAICYSLRKGYNWDTLSRKFQSVELNHLLVENVLLELKEPIDAKRALGFFHWSAQRKNFAHEVRSYGLMVSILVRAQLLSDAQALLESVLKKNVGDSSTFLVADSLLASYKVIVSSPLVFNLLVQAYSKLRLFEIGFEVCCYLEEHGFSLSVTSYNSLIHVVQKSNQNSLIWKIYEHMIRRKIYPNEATIRIMINGLCKEGKLQATVDILDRINGKRCPPLVIINTCLIYRILEEGRIEVGMALLKGMLQRNMILDTVAHSLTVYAKLRLQNFDSALEVYEEMLKRGFSANSFVHTSFIGAYCSEGKIDEANWWFGEMENTGLKPYGESFNSLIEGCAKAGKLEESLSYCEKMIERGLVPSLLAFNEMVGKLREIGEVKQANAMLTRILDKGFSPNETTYSYLIRGYEKNDQIQEVLKLYYEMEYRLLSPGLLTFTSLIRSLCQCGNLDQAERYLRIMKERSLDPSEDTYEALITGYIEKDGAKALHHYNEMISKGFKPCCSYDFDRT
ncbi:pentatricopeptide repeat-containing protein At1g66345, mitochondrial [Mercurialis annua]|uniref:pentatricopeptide repeat-containing protein At1g66345, mitochondrial n=1 Tax=Mercurialis annua TaxID=3986 RepID=UPI00215FACFF|nr:pentatricopeptide repeat-containing protein At1g66345, mitochondrial [Mercurialis annua]